MPSVFFTLGRYDAAPRAALLAIYSDPATQAGGGFAAPPVQSSP